MFRSIPRVPTNLKRSMGVRVPGLIPIFINFLSKRSLPQPSGKLSLKTPKSPSNTLSSQAITPALRGSLKGDSSKPNSRKLEEYSKKKLRLTSAKRPTEIACLPFQYFIFNVLMYSKVTLIFSLVFVFSVLATGQVSNKILRAWR